MEIKLEPNLSDSESEIQHMLRIRIKIEQESVTMPTFKTEAADEVKQAEGKDFPNVNPKFCPFCTLSFPSANFLNQHMRSHILEKPHICRICKKEFRMQRWFVNHWRLKHSQFREKFLASQNKPVRCNICDKRFAYPSDLASHQTVHSNERPFSCDACGGNFKTIKNLKRHQMLMKTTDGETLVHKCSVCSAEFMSSVCLRVHLRARHPDEIVYQERNISGPEVHQCVFCSLSFPYRTKLHFHIKSHIQEKPHICRICKKEFSISNCFTTHWRLEHSKSREEFRESRKIFQCNLCEKRFTKRSDLTEHNTVHSSERPFSCKNCEKKYKAKGQLKRHELKVHKTDEKITALKCSVCSEQFMSDGFLRAHRRQFHKQDVINYVCETCGKLFSYKWHLDHHIIKSHKKATSTESGPVRHECNICKKVFRYRSKLEQHRRAHSNERPFACEICNLTFKAKRVVQEHQKRVHKMDFRQSVL